MGLRSHLNTVGSIKEIKEGDVLVIRAKEDKVDYLVKCKKIINGNEVLLSVGKNDYFNFDMYQAGVSWVWRVWNIGDAKITAITNTTEEFPRS